MALYSGSFPLSLSEHIEILVKFEFLGIDSEILFLKILILYRLKK